MPHEGIIYGAAKITHNPALRSIFGFAPDRMQQATGRFRLSASQNSCVIARKLQHRMQQATVDMLAISFFKS